MIGNVSPTNGSVDAVPARISTSIGAVLKVSVFATPVRVTVTDAKLENIAVA
jgi:hypothetical protein